MMDTKDYILKNMIKDFEEVEIRGFYVIPTDEDEEFDDGSGYNCMQIVGYNYDEDNAKKYYNFGDWHDVASLMNFGRNGISIDVERENGLVRIFWNDRKPRKINHIDAFLSVFTVYGEEII